MRQLNIVYFREDDVASEVASLALEDKDEEEVTNGNNAQTKKKKDKVWYYSTVTAHICQCKVMNTTNRNAIYAVCFSIIFSIIFRRNVQSFSCPAMLMAYLSWQMEMSK